MTRALRGIKSIQTEGDPFSADFCPRDLLDSVRNKTREETVAPAYSAFPRETHMADAARVFSRVAETPEAIELLREIVADHGPVMFPQSGGCCDGSSAMCYPLGGLLIGDHDVKLGEVDGAPL